MSTVVLRLKQFIDQHDYHKMEQGKGTHDNDMYINPYFTVQKQQIPYYLGKFMKKRESNLGNR